MLPPLVLLADSQLLFARTPSGPPYLASWLEYAPRPIQTAAYLGASNGDQLEFYELFQGAVGAVGVKDTRHVPAEPSSADLDYLDGADLVLLAGGDPQRGLAAFEQAGVTARVTQAYMRGALLIGVSAGAIQLGAAGFRFAPFLVDAHAEPEWTELRGAVTKAGSGMTGIGVPRGGGALFHRDGTLEPIRQPLLELAVAGENGLSETWLVPR